jgi:hypothetical protein
VIAGHGDRRGFEDDNFALSGQRALAVVMHLVETWAISPAHLDAQAWGTRNLVTLEAEESAQNRRVEVRLTGAGAHSECVSSSATHLTHDDGPVPLGNWSLDLDDFGGGRVPSALR